MLLVENQKSIEILDIPCFPNWEIMRIVEILSIVGFFKKSLIFLGFLV